MLFALNSNALIFLEATILQDDRDLPFLDS
jgi:hypothetical protein